MNSTISYGLQNYANAATKLNTAVARTLPAASTPTPSQASEATASATDVNRTGASQTARTSPPDTPARADRATPPSQALVEASVARIQAEQVASLAVTSIRAADDQIGQILDLKA